MHVDIERGFVIIQVSSILITLYAWEEYGKKRDDIIYLRIKNYVIPSYINAEFLFIFFQKKTISEFVNEIKSFLRQSNRSHLRITHKTYEKNDKILYPEMLSLAVNLLKILCFFLTVVNIGFVRGFTDTESNTRKYWN